MKVLVTAASKHGSTQMIADEVVRGLRDRHIDAVFAAPEAVHSLREYNAVVVGSAIYTGHWMAPVTSFIRSHHAELLGREVWLFSSGPVGDPPVPAAESAEAEHLAKEIGAREHRVFPGRIERARLGRLERVLARAVHAQEGDFRDWDAVQDWTKSIADALLGGVGAGGATDERDEPMFAAIPRSRPPS